MPPDHPSPENRQLDAVIRQLGKLLQSDPSIDWRTDRQWIGHILKRFAAGDGPSNSLSERLTGARFEVGGSEHLILEMRDDPTRVTDARGGLISELTSLRSPALQRFITHNS
jgi:hypothetical protein